MMKNRGYCWELRFDLNSLTKRFPIKIPSQVAMFVYSLISISCWTTKKSEDIFSHFLPNMCKQSVKLRPCTLVMLLEVNIGLH